ncbi:hypothetical protein [Luteococcus sp.]|uniref:hypothetical protein n=1 Tax=Luteococcus sp. TaxID=1969402 RepID=UPI0037354279
MAGTNTTSTTAKWSDKFDYLRTASAHPTMKGKHRQFRVLWCLWDHADGSLTPGSSYPGLSRIAAEVGTAKADVSRDIAWLIDTGFVIVSTEATATESRRYGFALPVGAAPTGGWGDTNRGVGAAPTKQTTYQTNEETIPSASDAPTSHADDSDLTVATTHSAVPPQGHDKSVPPQPNGWKLLHYRWGDNAAAIVDEAQRSAGSTMTDELCSLLTDTDEDFYLWCADNGPRIPHAAGPSRDEAIGDLTRKLRTYMRDEMVELAPAA